MPNKTMNFQVDVLPVTDAQYNLGNADYKWKLNGYTMTAITNAQIDDLFDDEVVNAESTTW